MVTSSQIVNAYGQSTPAGRPAQGALGLRGREPAARRARLRHVASRGRSGAADRRRRRDGQRHPHERRPPVRRPCPPGVLEPGGHQSARRRAVGPGRRRHHAARHGARGGDPRRRADRAVQEQHRQQGRLVRHPRELPDAPRHALRRHRPAPHAVLHHPAGVHRCRSARRRPGRPHEGLPAEPAGGLLRGRGGARDDAQAARSSTPATSRTPTRSSIGACT